MIVMIILTDSFVHLWHKFCIFPFSFKIKHKIKMFSLFMKEKIENTYFWWQRGGANDRVKAVLSLFNFESAPGVKYREYGIRWTALFTYSNIQITQW